MVAASITIPEGTSGLPGVGFGGYVGGVLTRGLHSASVRFHHPAPLGVPLMVETEGDQRQLASGETIFATATAAAVDAPAIPALPPLEEAELASERFEKDPAVEIRRCFGCGPDRAPGEGMRVFVGPIAGRDLVAGVWTPDEAFGASDVAHEYVWAALDCPGAWARRAFVDDRPSVTASMSVEILGSAAVGEPHLVMAWPLSSEGRKAWVATALVDPDGSVVATATSLWISIDPGRVGA